MLKKVLQTSHVHKTYEGRAAEWGNIKDTFTLEPGGIDNRLKQRVLTHLTRLGRNRYLEFIDFGCGDGRLLGHVMRAATAGRFVGVDHSFNMLCAARRHLTRLATRGELAWDLVVTGASTTPFPDDSFDLTSAKLLLHHVQHPLAVMREMSRVTKPNGYVLVLVPGPDYQRAYRISGGPWQPTGLPSKEESGNRDPLGRFTPEELKELAHQAGLWPVSTYSDNFEYQFRTIDHYLRFMRMIGADAKLHSYQFDQLDWAGPYHGILGGFIGPLSLACEFVTLEARKIADTAESAVPKQSSPQVDPLL